MELDGSSSLQISGPNLSLSDTSENTTFSLNETGSRNKMLKIEATSTAEDPSVTKSSTLQLETDGNISLNADSAIT
jgi:hypothetical protein